MQRELSFREALATVLSVGRQRVLTTSEPACLLNGEGRTLAETIHARQALPAFDFSAMDGYAIRTADVTESAGAEDNAQPPTSLRGPLRVKAVRAAEDANASLSVEPGEAVKIMTGGAIPRGADAVVMVEHTRTETQGQGAHWQGAQGQGRPGPWVWITHPPRGGQHIRRRGEDLAQGAQALARGTLLGAGSLTLLATLGVEQFQVYRRPRVAVLATGNELIPPSAVPRRGQVRNGSSYGLRALLQSAGAEVTLLGIAADDPNQLETTLAQVLTNHDVVLTSGGVSMGDYDHLPQVMEGLLRLHFHKLAMRPGRPLLFGESKDEGEGGLYFGLPGNPISSLVVCHQLVLPALRALLSQPQVLATPLRARLRESYPKADAKRHFARGRLLWFG